MTDLAHIAPAFIEMAHEIVWCTVATVDAQNRPWTRILHPIWEWDGTSLVGWIATKPTAIKVGHLDHSPHVSLTYWRPDHDTCTADCNATWHRDQPTRQAVWQRFADAPAPVGYDPSVIPGWTAPDVDSFAALRLVPLRLRVMPGSLLTAGQGELLTWHDPAAD